MQEMEAQVLSTPDDKEKYDFVVKQVFSNRQILARIVKRFVSEMEPFSVEEIQTKYIDPEQITVSKTYVQKNLTNMTDGLCTEDKSNNEGNVTYDIMFRLVYPGEKDKQIGMYINIEMQNSYYPGYAIESRAVYYAARRLSSQLQKIDNDTNYGQLQKVYSIWIVMGDNVPRHFGKEDCNVRMLSINKTDLVGKSAIKRETYDLMNVIVICLNDKAKVTDETLLLIQTLCSKIVNKEEKISRLCNMGINMDSSLEGGMENMCNLGEGIAKDTEIKEKKQTAIRLFDMNLSLNQIVMATMVPMHTIIQWLKEAGRSPV